MSLSPFGNGRVQVSTGGHLVATALYRKGYYFTATNDRTLTTLFAICEVDTMTNTLYQPNLSLSADQESLLRTALSSNPRGSPQNATLPYSTNGIQNGSTNNASLNDSKIFASPDENVDGQMNDSPLFDDLDDANFDWDTNGRPLFGDINGNDYDENGDLHDKRKASTGSDEGENKRQEGDTKTPKKPGRKPLTAEPTTVS